MSTHYIVPTFNKSTPNKVHNELAVTGQNTVSHPVANTGWVSAIATESIPVNVDGEYVFVIRIDNIGNTFMRIGVTTLETFDSDKESYPGGHGMTGSALNLDDGNYNTPRGSNLINFTITKAAKELIVVVTIAKEGAQKLIRWIVNGVASENHDCTSDCKGGFFSRASALYPVVSLPIQNQQITTIPIDQVTIRNVEVNRLVAKFMEKSSTSTNQGAVANQQQASSAVTIAQLQQELEKERKRADLAESQLQQEKQQSAVKDQQLQQQSSEITQLKQQVLTLQSQ